MKKTTKKAEEALPVRWEDLYREMVTQRDVAIAERDTSRALHRAALDRLTILHEGTNFAYWGLHAVSDSLAKIHNQSDSEKDRILFSYFMERVNEAMTRLEDCRGEEEAK